LAYETGISSSKILYSSNLNSQELQAIDDAQQRLMPYAENLFFDDSSTSNIDTILVSIRSIKMKYDISGAVASYIEGTGKGYGIVRELTGHGIGTDMHEKPMIPNYRKRLRGPRLRAGNTLAVEPMITLGSPDVHTGADGWAVIPDDGSLSCHYENTILITDNGPEILTLINK
jgi:methionine aminopeptidase